MFLSYEASEITYTSAEYVEIMIVFGESGRNEHERQRESDAVHVFHIEITLTTK